MGYIGVNNPLNNHLLYNFLRHHPCSAVFPTSCWNVKAKFEFMASWRLKSPWWRVVNVQQHEHPNPCFVTWTRNSWSIHTLIYWFIYLLIDWLIDWLVQVPGSLYWLFWMIPIPYITWWYFILYPQQINRVTWSWLIRFHGASWIALGGLFVGLVVWEVESLSEVSSKIILYKLN